MKLPRSTYWIFWTVVIALLIFVELAELTRLFTVPFASAVTNPVTFAIALIFVTIVALVGAIFIGIYVSQRLLSPRGFSPFEEEMLKMRADVTELKHQMQEFTAHGAGAAAGPPSGTADPPRPREPRP